MYQDQINNHDLPNRDPEINDTRTFMNIRNQEPQV